MSDVLLVTYAFCLSLPITIPWTILTIGITLLFIQFIVLLSKGGLDEIKPIFSAPLNIPLAIFAIAILCSGAANGGIGEAAQSLVGLRGMLVYFWAYWTIYFRAKLKPLCITAILGGGFLAGLFATMEQLTGYHPFSFHYLQGTGFLSGPMAFSGLAQLFSALAFSIFLKDGYKTLPAPINKTWVFLIIMFGNFLGLLFCSERSAWLGAISALLCASSLISRRITIFTSLFLMLIGTFSWLFLSVVRERLSALLNWHTDVSVSTRFTLWQKAWQTFKEAPIFGVGIRHFPHLRIEEALKQGHIALDHAHSNYLHILATTGIFGFGAYLYLCFSALKLAYVNQRYTQYSKIDQGICLGIFAGTVSLLVSGFFEYNFGTGQVRLAQWFLLAMLSSTMNKSALTIKVK